MTQGRVDRGRRWLARLVIVLVVMALVTVVIGLLIRAMIGDGTNADPLTGGTVEIAMLKIPVAGTVTALENTNVTVWQGRQAPVPEFTIEGLGPDRSFTTGQPPPEAVSALEGNVVYLGDNDHGPMILYAEAAPLRNPWDYVYEFFTGHGDRRLLRGTFDCCAMSSGGDGTVSPQFDLPYFEDETVAVVQWMSVPADAAIVAYRIDGEPAGFQRPVGRVVSLTVVRQQPYDVTITAYDAAGAVMETHGPYTVQHFDLP